MPFAMPKTKTFLTPAEYAVLGLVREKPAYGYELQRHLSGKRGLGRVCPVEPAMVYAILKSLSGLELIDGVWDNSAYPPKAVYTTTDQGQATFERWLHSPVGRMREVRLDFLVKLYFAMKEDIGAGAGAGRGADRRDEGIRRGDREGADGARHGHAGLRRDRAGIRSHRRRASRGPGWSDVWTACLQALPRRKVANQTIRGAQLKNWLGKSVFLSLVTIAAVFGLVACSSSKSSPAATATKAPAAAAPTTAPAAAAATGKITVFAASSLTDAFNEIKTNFIKANPGADIEFQFAGTPALRTQMEQGAKADVFASADLPNMQMALASGLVADAGKTFAKNSLVIITPKNNPKKVTGSGRPQDVRPQAGAGRSRSAGRQLRPPGPHDDVEGRELRRRLLGRSY